MKVKRMLAIDKEIFDEMMSICDKNGFYRNSFIVYILRENQDFIKTLKDDNLRVRNKENKARFQIYIDLDLYETLGKSKTHKIERLLEKIIHDYNHNIIDLKVK